MWDKELKMQDKELKCALSAARRLGSLLSNILPYREVGKILSNNLANGLLQKE